MTMTSQQIVSVSRLLTQLRPDWEPAGCHSAVSELAKDPRTPFELTIQAVQRAKIAANRSPSSINWTERFEQPLVQDEPCPVHAGCHARRLDGTFACCWNETHWPDEAPLWSERPGRPLPDVPELVSLRSRRGGLREGDGK